MKRANAVLDGREQWAVLTTDGRDFLRSVPDNTFNLIFGSPPYTNSRYYGKLRFKLQGEDYVKWAVEYFMLCLDKCDGLVAWVIDCKTKHFKWGATPFLIAADLHRAGVCLRHPAIYYRNGVQGSGGPDWLRNDFEFVICATKTPGKLNWSNNTACGWPPKWGSGGVNTNRMANGKRVNQWGATPHSTGPQRAAGGRQKNYRPGSQFDRVGDTRQGTPRKQNGSRETQTYKPPVISNPGNVIKQLYTAEDVAAILAMHGVPGYHGDVLHTYVGGGHMGHPLAHKNEAPFSLDIAEFFVKSFCPPGGLVGEPFCGSGTTPHAAVLNGRRCIAMEIRADQAKNAIKRMRNIQPQTLMPEPRALAIFDDTPMEPQRVAEWLQGHMFDRSEGPQPPPAGTGGTFSIDPRVPPHGG